MNEAKTSWNVDTSGYITASNPSTGTVTTDNCCITSTWWPNTWYYYSAPDKTGVAFRIASKLMEKKLVNVRGDVEKFVALVNLIVESM